MDRKELYEYLKTLNPQDFKEVEVANPGGFLRSIRDRLTKAKNVYGSIKRFIKQNWTAIEYSDKEVILVGIYDEALIGVYVKITYSSSCDNKIIRTSSGFHGAKVTIFQHYNRKHIINNNYRV